MSDEKPKIVIKKDGPLRVEGLKKFTNSRNEPIEIPKFLSLCRCGASKRKPYCDGTHRSTGFTDEKSDDRVPDRRNTYGGKKISIHDNRGICAHSGYCTGISPEVFRAGTEPWIDPDATGREEIINTIKMCPSGALSYSVDGTEHRDRDSEPEIHISRNGPYRVRGGVDIENNDGSTVDLGEGASKEHYTLCRCGHSRNKPMCDGSHWYVAFRDDEAVTIAAANRAREQGEPDWVTVAETGELSNDSFKPLSLKNQQIVLSKINDAYGAVDGVCPHQGGPLKDGTIEDGNLICPWHGHAFDAFTGRALGPDSDLKSYEVEERDDGIYIQIEAPSRSAWTVGHLIAETMVNWGITHVFGMVGHSNLGLAEAIRVQEEKGKLTYIGIRHEGAASFACSGFAKVTGRPAACLTIAGPGATNLLTGLWDARMDRTPVLALTGQINTQFLGPGAFQEIDLRAAFNSVAAFSKVVLPNSDHGELVSLALKNAVVNRDVAHLIVPDEVQIMDAGECGPSWPEGRLSETAITPPKESLNQAMYRIERCRWPAIIVGYGARDAMEKIIGLAERINAPILTTYKAKGQISDFHPLACGVLGRSGTPVSSWFMNKADLLIVFGASFSQHTGIEEDKPIIQVDYDRMALGKFHPVDTPIWGEVGITAGLLTDMLPESLSCTNDCRNEVKERWRLWREEKDRRAAATNGRGLNSALIFDVLSKTAPEDALYSLDVGNNTYSYGRYFECRDNPVILCGYLGSIGFAFPAAMGAFMANTGRKIISVSGDGGFAQYMGEFNTAVKYNMDITHILLNNSELGKITKEQRDEKLTVWQTDLTNPHFAEYAVDCGGMGIRVDKYKQLEKAIREAVEHGGPSLVEIIADPELV